MKALVLGMSGIPCAASVAFSADIQDCQASIHVVLPRSGKLVYRAAVPARRGSAVEHSPCRSAGDAESKKTASYWPACTCASRLCAQYVWKPATEMFISSLPSTLLATRSSCALCQNQSSFVVTNG